MQCGPEFLASTREGLPEWTFVADPISPDEPEWVREQFQGNPWGTQTRPR